MKWNDRGQPTWRGMEFVPYLRMTIYQQQEARDRFSPDGRRGYWRHIEMWSFAVRKDGHVSTACPYIEPAGTYIEVDAVTLEEVQDGRPAASLCGQPDP